MLSEAHGGLPAELQPYGGFLAGLMAAREEP